MDFGAKPGLGTVWELLGQLTGSLSIEDKTICSSSSSVEIRKFYAEIEMKSKFSIKKKLSQISYFYKEHINGT